MPAGPKRELSLFDSTCIIVGIIIGAGIYQTTPGVAGGVAGAAAWIHGTVGLLGLEAWRWVCVLAIWMVGGLLSLFGALGYAELASAYPREGGDYVYLTQAYGRWAGYLFGWVQLVIVRPGDIGAMAFAFATYAVAMWNPFGSSEQAVSAAGRLYAGAAVLILTLINVMGVRQGKWTQNILTTVKVLGLLAIGAVAFGATGKSAQGAQAAFTGGLPVSVALIMVLFTFGGWNEMAYVSAEVKNPQRNIVRALLLGTVAVTILYLLINVAFLSVLSYEGFAKSNAVATDCVSTIFPTAGGVLVSTLVCISALGAVNGLIFTGARISYALGAEHPAFRPLGRWDPRSQTPTRALLVQGAIALGLILLLGSFLNALIYTAAAVYAFYLATSAGLVVLRFKQPQIERPYRVTGYPVTTVIFCLVCAYLIHSSITYAWANLPSWYGIPKCFVVLAGALAVGLIIYWLTEVRGSGRPGLDVPRQSRQN
jgi:amino acid transporter